jgi:hypothetical protein
MAPFGFGKKLVSADGKTIIWEWYPTNSKVKGDLYRVEGRKRKLVFQDVKVPRRESTSGNAQAERIYLVPHRDKAIVATVRQVFELYGLHGLSYRQIASSLNARGLRYYGKQFSFSLVNEIIRNPAYAGVTVFGKKLTADHYTFDGEGTLIEVRRATTDDERAAMAQAMRKEATHKPLVSPELWIAVQGRQSRQTANREDNSVVLPPRSADFWLKGLLYCGHCGKHLTSRREQRGAVYVCSSYSNAHSSGQVKQCGFQAITHAAAEKLIFDKLKEMEIAFDQLAGNTARAGLNSQFAALYDASEENTERMRTIVEEGTGAILAHFKANYDLSAKELRAVRRASGQFLEWDGKLDGFHRAQLPVELTEFKAAIEQAEQLAVAKATAKVERLKAELKEFTDFQRNANPMQQELMKPEADALVAQIDVWEAKCRPIRARVRELWQRYGNIREQNALLMKEWSGTDERVKGETLKRIIRKVVLYWDKVWHEAEATPGRERKTERPGRWRYTLDETRITWDFHGCDSFGSNSAAQQTAQQCDSLGSW